MFNKLTNTVAASVAAATVAFAATSADACTTSPCQPTGGNTTATSISEGGTAYVENNNTFKGAEIPAVSALFGGANSSTAVPCARSISIAGAVSVNDARGKAYEQCMEKMASIVTKAGAERAILEIGINNAANNNPAGLYDAAKEIAIKLGIELPDYVLAPTPVATPGAPVAASPEATPVVAVDPTTGKVAAIGYKLCPPETNKAGQKIKANENCDYTPGM